VICASAGNTIRHPGDVHPLFNLCGAHLAILFVGHGGYDLEPPGRFDSCPEDRPS
jgi:hypothetical protein